MRVTLGALVGHRYTYAPPCCGASRCRRTFISLSVSLWNDLADPVFDGVELAGFKSMVNVFFIGLSCSIPTIVFYHFSLSLLSVYIGWYCGAGVFGLIGCISLSLSLAPLLIKMMNDNRSHTYELHIRVAHKSYSQESYIRVTHKSHT